MTHKTSDVEARRNWNERLEEIIAFTANGAPPSDWQWECKMAEECLRENHPHKANERYLEAAVRLGVEDMKRLQAMREEIGLHPACLTVLRAWTEKMPWKPGDHHSHALLAEAMLALLPLFEAFAKRTGLIPRVQEFAEVLQEKRAAVHDPRLNPFSSTYAELRKLAARMDEGFTRVREAGWLLPDNLRDPQ